MPLIVIFSATGSPQPMITWLHEDGILHESIDGSLRLSPEDTRLHEGNYTCLARNLAGEQRAVVNVEFGDNEVTPTPLVLTPITILNCPDNVPGILKT